MTVSIIGSTNGARSPLLRLLGLCWRDPIRCLHVLACQIGLLVLGLIGLGSAGLGIDYLHARLVPSAKPVAWPLHWAPPSAWSPMIVLWVIASIVVVSALLRGVLTWLAAVQLAQLVHQRVIADLQTAVFAKLQHLHFRFFDQHSRGEIINRATGDIAAIRNFVDTVLIQALVTVLTIVVYLIYMLSINPVLTLACLSLVPVSVCVCLRHARLTHPLYVRNRALFDRMIRTLAESIEGVAVIKGFAREPEMGTHFKSDNEAVREQQRQIFWRMSLFTPSIDFLTQLSLVILLLYGGWLVVTGALALGTGLVVFAGLLQQFANQVTTIGQIANGVQESLTGARRVFDILDAPAGLPLAAVPQVPDPAGTGDHAGAGSVSFSYVDFHHIDAGPVVLKDVSFSIAPGECVAIVGETGAGKSALLSLIPRFYDPSSGTVRVDGLDVRDWDLQALRRRVAVVFQENFLFSDTVSENIAFGRPDASQADIEAAARAACAHEFVEALPQGYDTILGESGVDLSGGQRQRLTIARALLADPAILLLDDPTAAIDPETEHEILAAIDRALAGRTTFVVAHRLSTLRRADRILVLERGRIVQVGKHAELLQQEGPYRSAALHQMVDAESRQWLAEEAGQEAVV